MHDLVAFLPSFGRSNAHPVFCKSSSLLACSVLSKFLLNDLPYLFGTPKISFAHPRRQYGPRGKSPATDSPNPKLEGGQKVLIVWLLVFDIFDSYYSFYLYIEG